MSILSRFRNWKPAVGGPVVGVDLGGERVKLVAVVECEAGLEVAAWGVAPMPADAVREGVVVDVPGAAEALRRLVTLNDLRGCDAVAAVPACAKSEDTDPGRQAAARSRAAVLSAAGLKPTAVDLEDHAVLFALAQADGQSTAPTVYLDFGVSATKLSVAVGTAFRAGRSLPPNDLGAVLSALTELPEETVDIGSTELVLTGGGADLSTAQARLSQALGVPVRRGDPFETGRLKASRVAALEAVEHGPLLALAAGLGMRPWLCGEFPPAGGSANAS